MTGGSRKAYHPSLGGGKNPTGGGKNHTLPAFYAILFLMTDTRFFQPFTRNDTWGFYIPELFGVPGVYYVGNFDCVFKALKTAADMKACL